MTQTQEKEAGGGVPNDYQEMLTSCTWIVVTAITSGQPLSNAMAQVIAFVRACDKENRAALKAKETP